MQITIDIPEVLYKAIKKCGYIYEDNVEDVALSIIGGKQLSQRYRGWIPVTERLPEEGKPVTASTEWFIYYDARYTKACGWEWAYDTEGDFWQPLTGVTAWMPKLKPYNPESEVTDGKPDI